MLGCEYKQKEAQTEPSEIMVGQPRLLIWDKPYCRKQLSIISEIPLRERNIYNSFHLTKLWLENSVLYV